MKPQDPRSDSQLLKDSAQDADAFGIFYQRHASAVAGYFAKRAGDRSLVADLTSETFAQAFASRRRYRDTGGPATGWLFTIARRQLGEYHRTQRISAKYRIRLGMTIDRSVDDFDRVTEADALEQLQSNLDASLDTLSETSAQAVKLRIGHGMSYQAVADRLGCSSGAARVRVSRALHQLHEHLDNTATQTLPKQNVANELGKQP